MAGINKCIRINYRSRTRNNGFIVVPVLTSVTYCFSAIYPHCRLQILQSIEILSRDGMMRGGGDRVAQPRAPSGGEQKRVVEGPGPSRDMAISALFARFSALILAQKPKVRLTFSPSATPAPSRTSTSARQPPTLIVLRLFSILHQSVSRCSPFALRLCVCVAAASVHEALHRQILARTHLLVGPVRFDRLLRTWLSSHPNNAVRFAYIVSVFLLRFSMSLVI